MNWKIKQTIDLTRGINAGQGQCMIFPLLFAGDSSAHVWEVEVLNDGQPVTISDSISARFIRPSGDTVTQDGTKSGNVASVTIPQAVYAYEGVVHAVMRATVSGTSTTTIGAIVFEVQKSTTGSIIDPGTVVPDLEELLDEINDMRAATAAANAAATNALSNFAPAFAEATANAAGSYVTYTDGKLYRLPEGHAANATWANTAKTEVTAGGELRDMESAVNITLGLTELTNYVSGAYMATNGETITPSTPVYNGNYVYMITECRPGDCFYIVGRGGSTPRLWAFVDADNHILSPVAEANAQTDGAAIKAPAYADRLVVNFNVGAVATHHAYRYGTIAEIHALEERHDEEIAELHEQVDEVVLPSPNLFDPDDPDYLTGHYATDSQVVESEAYNATGFIPVGAGETLAFSNDGQAVSARFVAVFGQPSMNNGLQTLERIDSYTNPRQVSIYVRVTFRAEYRYFQIQNDRVGAYVPYGGYYAKGVPEIEQALRKNLRDRFDIYSTGDIEDFLDSMEAVYAAGNCDVYIHAGEYVYTNAFIESLISSGKQGVPIGRNNRYYFETGAKLTCKYTGAQSMPVWFGLNSTYNGSGSFELHNLNMEASKICYGVHDEYNGSDEFYRNVYDHCRIIVDNTGVTTTDSGYNKCIGGGLGGNAEIIIDGCCFDCVSSPTQDVSYHGNASGDNAHLLVKDSWFRHTLSLNGHAPNMSDDEKAVIFCNNSLGSALHYGSPDYAYLWSVKEWNNTIRSA